MYAITIMVGPAAWSLLFKTEESWNASLFVMKESVPGSVFALTDDFGQHCEANRDSVHGWMAEDMEQTRVAHIERTLYHERLKVDIQRRAERDPSLHMLRPGPATLSGGMMIPPPPGFNGR